MTGSPSLPGGTFDPLDGELPAEARALLEACGDQRDRHGLALAWSGTELRARNREMRTTPAFRSLFMPFDNLLFFGDSGNGDLFALAIDADGVVRRSDVFRWDHETDERAWYAGGAGQFIAKRRDPAG